jgi:hypothetical protein
MMWVDWKQNSFETMPDPYFYSFWLGPDSDLCMSSVGVYSGYSHVSGVNSENVSWVAPNQEITQILVEEFKQVPQVKYICAQFGQEEITIWTLLESYNRAAREKVYEKELEICALLRIYDFEFRVTSIDIVSPDELVRAGSYQIYRRQ